MTETKTGISTREVLEPIKEVLDELFTLLEAMETRADAVLHFLKEQGIAADEKLAPYLEQAGNASSVKWLAARKRMEYLLSPIEKEAKDQGKEKKKDEGEHNDKDKDPGKETVAKDTEKPKVANPAADHLTANENAHPQEETAPEPVNDERKEVSQASHKNE